MLAPSGPASPFALRAWGSTKRNELGRASGRKRLTLLFVSRQGRYEKDPTLPLASRRAGSFLLLAPRTQCERRSRPRRGEHRRCESKKRNQRNGTKETEPKKPASPDGANPASRSFRHFPTRHPGSFGKRQASMPAVLRVFDAQCGVAKIKSRQARRVRPTPRTGTPTPAPSAPSHPAHSARASCAVGGCARRPCVPRRRRCRPRRGRAAASGCRRVRGGS